ncbi:MAG: hypothetical protein M5U34_19305 [Chloroflexi bacterium]|nr:hypothetical protein [Chloroflexota bacterium]
MQREYGETAVVTPLISSPFRLETDRSTLLFCREDMGETAVVTPSHIFPLSGWKLTTVPCCFVERIWGNGRCHPLSFLALSGWRPTAVPCCLGERIWGKRPLSPGKHHLICVNNAPSPSIITSLTVHPHTSTIQAWTQGATHPDQN